MTSLRLYIAIICGILISSATYAQNLPVESYRTPLMPYPTAADAHAKITPNRYVQIVKEWQDEEGKLHGEFTFPFSWLERQVFVRIEGCAAPYSLYINGKLAGDSTNGHVAKEINITKLCREDKNSVELRLMNNDEVKDIEYFTRGTSQPIVYIISQPRVRIRDVAWRTNIGMGGVVNIDFSAVMKNETLGAKTSRIYYELFLNDTLRLTGGHRDVALGMYGVDTMRFGAPVPDSILWSIESPSQISLRLKNRIAGRDVEFYDLDVALRQLEYKDGKFYVNNRAENISWHEMSPLATTKELSEAYNAGIRAIRFTAGYVRDELLEWCDANGVYVALTAPINSSIAGKSRKRGGNPSNNPRWRGEYIERVTAMIHTTKRHASVIAYYLADESSNGICLYESYLAAKAISDRPIFYEDGTREWNCD